MIHRFILLLICVSHCLTAMAGAVVVNGNRVAVSERIDSMSAAKLWDFSRDGIIEAAKLRSVNYGDLLLMEFLPIMRSDFNIYGNLTQINRLEGRDWFLNIDSMDLMPCKTTYPIHGHYRKFQQQDERFIGHIISHESFGHTVIVSAGDTVWNARADEMDIDISIFTDSTDFLTGSTYGRSNSFKIVRLYGDDSALPVAVCMESDYDGRLGDGSTAYIFPLSEHPSQHELPIAARRMQNRPNRLNKASSEHNSHGSDGISEFINPNALSISTDSNKITVNAENSILPADIVIYDMMGRIVSTHRLATSTITINDIPQGEIVITIFPDDKTISPLSHKIISNPL